ncbi:MAG: MBL fold metallo-hydrolase [Microcella sp.]|nr:MBL fold metallo-hydrolase [Microcella sp.]
MTEPMRVQFWGAVGTVTGSRTIVEVDDRRVLVDCGLFQGYKQLRLRNRAAFPVPPESIDAVVLTHAHLDHTGYLPALVRDGFHGPVFCTPGTAQLLGLLLPDSGYLQEEEARFARRKKYSKHEEPTPLYTVADAERALESLVPRPFDTDIDLSAGHAGADLVARFVAAGHILGAAQVRLTSRGRTIHFSGDLGRDDDALMHGPTPLEPANLVIAESTYGDRLHPEANPEDELGEVIARVVGRGGVVIIPAFAVGRAQALLLHLARLRRKNAIPSVPIYLNSPMAVDATALYRAYPAEHNIDEHDYVEMYSTATMVSTVDDSKLLNLRGGPMIIISASGMLTGGRVLHHIAAYGDDPRNAILLTGYQAPGTRGGRLAGGAEELRIFGRDVPIRAEVVQLQSMSAHADADGILRWMAAGVSPGMRVALNHGEPGSADALRLRIERELKLTVIVPEHGQQLDV